MGGLSVEPVLALALQQLGVDERQHPERVQAYRALLGLPSAPGPWSLALVQWCGLQACGAAWPLPRVGVLSTFMTRVAPTVLLRHRPHAGAIFVLYSKHRQRYVHAGFCVKRTATGWVTLEGNTDPYQSRCGPLVYQHERGFGDRDRFLWWWRSATTEEAV